jgi:NitT/TauT family transport system substrate-binding protein
MVCGACSSGASGTPSGTAPTSFRLGYFPNINHAAALIGVENGLFAAELGTGTKLETSLFNAGPEVVTALFNDALDAAYVGPNPAVNAFTKSGGTAIKIVAGAASGGAALVVAKSIASAKDLKGKTLASPQLGNTQDVALRNWLKEQGYKPDTSGGGDVHVAPQENSATLAAFKAGQIAGAWVPEPWATRLVEEGGGHVLVDEATLWPNGKFATVNLVVRTKFLNEHPETVKALLRGHIKALDFIKANPAQAQTKINDALGKISGKRLDDKVLADAWGNLTFTADPIAASLPVMAQRALDLGLIKNANLTGIYDLTFLNAELVKDGQVAIATG